MLYHIIYISNAISHFEEHDFVNLLVQSRNNNARNSITGMLLYSTAHFIQYLEGDEIDIMRLFERLKTDCRHYDMEAISQGPIIQRNFSTWNMEYQTVSKTELEQMVGTADILKNKDAVNRTIKLVKLFKPLRQ